MKMRVLCGHVLVSGVSLVSMATFEVVQHPLLWFWGVVSITNLSSQLLLHVECVCVCGGGYWLGVCEAVGVSLVTYVTGFGKTFRMGFF